MKILTAKFVNGRLDVPDGTIHEGDTVTLLVPETEGTFEVTAEESARLEEAIAAYRQAIFLKPDYPEARYNLGVALQDRGQLVEAIAAYRQAIALKPNLPEAHNNLGNAFKEAGQLEDAIAAFRQAIVLKPNLPEAHNNLGNALRDRGQLDEAIASFRQATALRPNYPEAHSNLGNSLKDQGQLDKAIASYRQAIAHHANFPGVHSNLIYTLHFHPGVDAGAITEEQQRWNQQFAVPLRKSLRAHANDRAPERRLRIGYVSPDFWHHVICHFLTPLLEAHDHTSLEIFCYASVRRPDAITERLKKTADVWRDVLGLRDEALADLIREDQIDILVDLTQHMADHRLLGFARKPAPVQVGWVGYPASTGLETMDYRFTDGLMEPEGSAWSDSVETPVRLPDSWFCFDPIDEYPEPGPLPALTAGQVTFGSLNNFCKINETVLHLWVQVLQRVPDSRLLLQCPPGSTQARARQWFEAHGLASHRLELVSRTATRAEFLRLFERIDLALETCPYTGGTTTCEAIWMGVPVPTFPGASAVSRIGLSMLSAIGLHELIAADPEDYVRLTADLATDLPRLAELRSTLRRRMKGSAFMNAPRFAQNVEAAYRKMWRQWCARQSARLA